MAVLQNTPNAEDGLAPGTGDHGWQLKPATLPSVEVPRLAKVLAYHTIVGRGRLGAHIVAASPRRSRLGGDRRALITFDDGDPSLVESAARVVETHEIPAIAFIVAGVLDTDRPYWWQEVGALVQAGARLPGEPQAGPDEAVRAIKWLPEEDRLAAIEDLRVQVPAADTSIRQLTREDLRFLEECGIEVGNHTMSHPILSRCSDERVEQEIRDAHEVLTDALGHPPRFFAFPDRDWDPRVKPILQNLGYEGAFLFDHRINKLPIRDPFRISRLRVSTETPMWKFRLIVSGIHPWIHHKLLRRP